MHDASGDPGRYALSRRSVLRAAGGVGLAGVVLGGGIAAGVSAVIASPARADSTTGDRIVMLGVNGGPVLQPQHYEPAIALVVGGYVYLIDCGADAARQVTRAGLGFANLQNVFLTHHHLDHSAGLPALRLHGWLYSPSSLRSLDVWGPPTMSAMMAGLETAFMQEVNLFEAIGIAGIPVTAHEMVIPDPRNGIFPVMEDERVIVEGTRVFHGPEVPYAYAYRFTIKSSGKKVVFSGDTAAPNANLIALADGADILVHEVQDNDAIDAYIKSLNFPPDQEAAVIEHVHNSHSNVIDVPGVAKSAGVGKLVMCHYAPGPEPTSVFLSKATAAANQIGYTGAIIAPTDLDAIPI